MGVTCAALCSVVVQVGSNIGVHSLHVAATGYPTISIEGFRPTAARTFCSKLLNRFEHMYGELGNPELAHFSGQTTHPVRRLTPTVVSSAVGEAEGSICFDSNADNMGGTNAMSKKTDCPDVSMNRVKRLDAIIDDAEAAIGRPIGAPTVAKIDIEGGG